MRRTALLAPCFAAWILSAQALPVRTFRQWIAGQEAGGASLEIRTEGADQVAVSREWVALERMGLAVRQEMDETVRRRPDGALAFTWRVSLSQEPFEGTAEWSPAAPRVLRLRPRNGAAVEKPVPEGALLWPGDVEAGYREAARLRRPLRIVTFSFPLQQWSTVALRPEGPAPLPGFPDAVRFTGEEEDGPVRNPLESWISPTAGELRQSGQLGALAFLVQRSELPAPAPSSAAPAGFFEQTLQALPPHPFLPWLASITLRATGRTDDLPEDSQQRRVEGGRWQLTRALPPTPAEAAEPPVRGTPPAAEAPYLAATPLVQFRDPAFDGLLRRMALPPGLGRWELARRVTGFVFEWITEKDYSVGFASALEVCHRPAGDCTEHGVLAVALLRRLGVPARGVTGWVALDGTLGLHFWVEVRIGGRWIPVDPTFDQAPASAFRIKLATSDLADLGSVGWDGAAAAMRGLTWTPESWGGPVRLDGDQVTAPDGSWLRVPGARWRLDQGTLVLDLPRAGSQEVRATLRPDPASRRGMRHLAGARSLRTGWWDPASRSLWMALPRDRWLRVDGIPEAAAYGLLDQMETGSSATGR